MSIHMTKTRKVLERIGSDTDPMGVYFAQTDEDQPFGPMKNHMRITRRDFMDMGSPDQITVTVEPGDLLNIEDQP